MKRIGAFLIALAASGAAIAQTPPASPFTLTVPVRIENAMEANRLRIYCIVSRLDAGATGGSTPANMIADGTAEVALTAGRFVGDVSVPTTLRVASPSGARSYSCNLELTGRTATGGTSSFTSTPAFMRSTGRAVTRAIWSTQGAITP